MDEDDMEEEQERKILIKRKGKEIEARKRKMC
jgi:hypothetical protein